MATTNIFTGKGEAYGCLAGALLLTKTSPANETRRASWLVAADRTISLNAAPEGGYKVQDAIAGTETSCLNMKIARAKAAEILSSRPEALESRDETMPDENR